MKAHARASDPPTSQDAAASVRGITRTHTLLLSLLTAGPATDETLMQRWEGLVEAGHPGFPHLISPSGLRSRRAELVALGKVEASGEHKLTASGRRTIVWQLVTEPTLW